MPGEEQVTHGHFKPALSEFGRLEAELDAAIIFAASAAELYGAGQEEYANACISDAREGYELVITALSTNNFTADELRRVEPKVNQLQETLDQLRAAAKPAAA